MIIEKEFTFDSAHFLPNLTPGHKCIRLHGHTYRVFISVEGPLTELEQWVMDFGDLKRAAKPLIDSLDHQLLNAIPGLENPTAEVIAKYIYDKLLHKIPLLHSVRVDETPTSRAIYSGDS